MMNTKLLNEAINLIIDLFDAEGIMESTESIAARVTEWYTKTEIVDAEMLAAAAITGPYTFGTSWHDLLEWKEFYFPTIPIEEIFNTPDSWIDEMLEKQANFSIEEIECSQRDALWR